MHSPLRHIANFNSFKFLEAFLSEIPAVVSGFCSWFGISRFYRETVRMQDFIYSWQNCSPTNLCRWSPLGKFFARTARNGCVHYGQKKSATLWTCRLTRVRVSAGEPIPALVKCRIGSRYELWSCMQVLDMSRNSKSSEMSGEILCFSAVFSDIGVPVFLGVLWWNVYAFFSKRSIH